ncbi:MAG: DnaD domain protein [Bacilli bacterium]|nr:DnaD domain protein [Bacilli bacterium]MDD4406635.1 DnaD domain protein [Bacilli bacterium]
MSNTILEGIVKQKDYIFKTQIFKIANNFNFNTSELLLIIYFLNQESPSFNIPEIKNITYLDDKEIMDAFSSLSGKGIISININKNANGIICEDIDLSNLYKYIVSDINTSVKKQANINIFNIFEKEFGRTLSPIEFEIINAWLKSGISEELIIGALKEATFNGVSNLRYIDKIIYEWNKKGFKNMEDLHNHLKKKEPNENKVLFDYNWLEDEE